MRDWNPVNLGDHVKPLCGFPFDSERFTTDAGLPLIRIRDILSGVPETNYAGPSPAGYLVDPGDLLIGMDGDFHIALWNGVRSLLNQRVLKLSERPGSKIDLNFLFFRLQPLLLEINARTTGTTVKHLSTDDI